MLMPDAPPKMICLMRFLPMLCADLRFSSSSDAAEDAARADAFAIFFC